MVVHLALGPELQTGDGPVRGERTDPPAAMVALAGGERVAKPIALVQGCAYLAHIRATEA